MAIILLIGLLLLAAAVALAVHGASGAYLRSRTLVADVGAYGFGGTGGAAVDRPPSSSFLSNLVLRVGRDFERRVGHEQAREIRVLLNAAGCYRTTVARYLGYRVVATVVPPLTLLAFGGATAATLVAAVVVAGLGWITPPFVLKRRARRRVAEIDYEVPELVDLLVTTVEAGVGFAAALQLSARRVRGPLGEELRLAMREQSMGLSVDEALANLLERTNQSASMRAFVQAIVQGETLGVSIGKILRDLATDMRKRRRRLAEERAQKAPVKLLFPLVMLILPAMLVVVLGPAAYAFGHALGG
jgi:tight adherence protein C